MSVLSSTVCGRRWWSWSSTVRPQHSNVQFSKTASEYSEFHLFLLAPITLDPNTAYSWLSLSSDLTSVTNSGSLQQLPGNPERFSHFVFVLGSEGFTSGRHAWEVEVGNKVDWMLGVVKESIDRKGRISGCPSSGFWMISHYEGEYVAMTSPSTPLHLEGELTRVRVQLDYDSGEVTFSNPVSMTPIYTFTDLFTERIFPFFCPGANVNGNNTNLLKICPAKVAVWNSVTWWFETLADFKFKKYLRCEFNNLERLHQFMFLREVNMRN